MVIGHTDCGMAGADANKVKAKMIEYGIDEAEIDKVDLAEWIGAIPDEEQNVIETVEKIKNHPLITDKVPIHGLIIDIVSGKLDVVSVRNDVLAYCRKVFKFGFFQFSSYYVLADVDHRGFKKRQDVHAFRVSESCIVFNQLRSVLGEHELSIENSLVRGCFLGNSLQGIFHDSYCSIIIFL